MTDRRVFFFVHVPKCGGSTFKSIMRRNFAKGYLEEYRLLEPRELRYRCGDVDRLLDFLPELRFFSGHCISTDLPFEREDVEVFALSIVREPVGRILSWYFYNRNTHHYRQVEKETSLEAYLDRALREYDFLSDPWRWSQLADLTDLRGSAGLDRIVSLSQSGRLLLCPLERFDEFLCLLEVTWPLDFVDCSYPHRANVSRQDQGVSTSLEPILEKLEEVPAIQTDRELLAFADAELTRRLEEAFGGDEEKRRHVLDLRRRSVRARRAEFWWRRPARRVRALLP